VANAGLSETEADSLLDPKLKRDLPLIAQFGLIGGVFVACLFFIIGIGVASGFNENVFFCLSGVFYVTGVVLSIKPKTSLKRLGLVFIFLSLPWGISFGVMFKHYRVAATLFYCAYFFGLFYFIIYNKLKIVFFAIFLYLFFDCILQFYLKISFPSKIFSTSNFSDNYLFLYKAWIFVPIFAAPAFLAIFRLSNWPPKPSNKPLLSARLEGLFDAAAKGTLLTFLFLDIVVLLPIPILSDPSRFLWLDFVEKGQILAFLAAGGAAGFVLRSFKPAAGGLALAFLSYLYPPLALGVALAIFAKNKGRNYVLGFAAAYLALALIVYYTQADLTFPQKALTLFGAGLALSIPAALLARKSHKKAPKSEKTKNGPFSRPVRIGVAIVAATFLLVFNLSIAKNERLLINGRVAILPLTPRDPLSFLQGYFVDLRLRAESDVLANLRESQIERRRGEGLAVMAEKDGIAVFERLYDGRPLKDGEFKLAYRLRPNRAVRIAGGGYFYQEGQAEEYEKMAFVETRVSPDGRAILAAPLDSKLQKIEPVPIDLKKRPKTP
jgi:uncharacterized membrane-anchored protein